MNYDEARRVEVASAVGVSDRDKTVENLIIALAYRYDSDKEGMPCFCASSPTLDRHGRVISHTPRCQLARMTLSRWSSTPAQEPLDVGRLAEAERIVRERRRKHDPDGYLWMDSTQEHANALAAEYARLRDEEEERP